jgi:hypothetical protein
VQQARIAERAQQNKNGASGAKYNNQQSGPTPTSGKGNFLMPNSGGAPFNSNFNHLPYGDDDDYRRR